MGDLSLASVHLYPVKGLHGLTPPAALVRPWGLEGDRRWMIVDPDGRFLTQRACRGMALITPIPTSEGLTLTRAGSRPCPVRFPDVEAPQRVVTVWNDTVRARDAGDVAAHWLSEALGRECRLVWMHVPELARIRDLSGEDVPVSFADGYPLLVASMASLNDLNARLAPKPAIPMNRFRANIVVEGGLPWEEDSWQLLSIGTALIRIVAACARCVVTTIDQHTGTIPTPGEPLGTLSTFRRAKDGIMFAQNAVVEKAGMITAGDKVEVLERGPSNLVLAG
ncbi:MOSC domain-containing protein [Acetobacter suratthaniensis]|uniref:MOSC domain-containing protein n=1 Tax=Acetobacter suratthaniensis TaxID=1502841 RepID=A0ABS3LHD3_9PROT|nr:MOSC N-terminal beta barrel domain-containing protein [Acetobacter suratthaniensis]MBO1327003.1 MOSC domain-containing protein [Acetobacter suratthaniensis]MCX2565387.1 MOSC domain-containing protein [Acetobacter suratthaniensis]